ncbi:hypothetical protein OAM96_01705 [Candidatus Poseidoniaceae archaeon]|jgi:hypothetical protein|nr:hypothetical protein [Candidatus Poseidoniaceae archaeon]MDC0340652.1 hypothetical protein [Candidatus Poseidoniaceae archaeon]|tara:strand:+ start:255 stop:821 length:567 start_codon:yes stop_codon:yes gene_type:complete
MTDIIYPSTVNWLSPFEIFLPVVLTYLIAVSPTIGMELWRNPNARKLERLRHSSGAILLLLCALYIIFIFFSIIMERRYPGLMGNDLMFGDELWGSLLILSVFILTGYFLWMKGEVGKGLKWFCGLGLLWFFFTGLGAFYLDSMFKTHIIEPEEIIYNWISSISGVIIPFVCLLLAYRDSVQFSNEEE